MFSLDTNILARAILDDDKKQSDLAKKILKKYSTDNSLYISSFALLELAWVLKSRGVEREKIASIFENIIHADGIIIGQKAILIAALDLYSKKNLDFGDCLIHAESHHLASAKTITFDKAFAKHCTHGLLAEQLDLS